jgi:hypothetical protein
VPVLYTGIFDEDAIKYALGRLGHRGSVAAPGFMNPEGLMIWHPAAQQLFKYTLHGDGHKG